MAEDGKKAAIGIGVAIIIGGIMLATKAKAAPPEGYVCPSCGLVFDTYEELVAHVQTEHPGARIPLEIDWK